MAVHQQVVAGAWEPEQNAWALPCRSPRDSGQHKASVTSKVKLADWERLKGV